MTDYVYFLQWQIVTYRVWHGFFVFASLLCVLYAEQGKKCSCALTFLNFLCLYYYEATFVIFVTAVCVLFALGTYWGQWQIVRRLAFTAAAGAVLSIGILFSQLVAFMGPEDAVKDIYYTIKARQFTDPDSPESAEVTEFYKSRNVAFFNNFASGTSLLHPSTLVTVTAHRHLSPYTPFIVIPVFLLIGAVAVCHVFMKSGRHESVLEDRTTPGSLFGVLRALGLIAACAVLIHAVLGILLPTTGAIVNSWRAWATGRLSLAILFGVVAFLGSMGFAAPPSDVPCARISRRKRWAPQRWRIRVRLEWSGRISCRP